MTDDCASMLETEYSSDVVTLDVHITVPAGGQEATTTAIDEEVISTTTGEETIVSETATATVEA